MRRLFALAPLLLFLVGPAPGENTPTGAEPPHRERIEWCDIWFTDANKDALPRVLLIGDSIARGYFPEVESALADRAYCGRYTTSRSVCGPVFFRELSLVLAQYPYAVIHVNNGLHGWAYTEAEYKAGLRRLFETLAQEAPDAQIVWATTTPVQADGGMAGHAARVPERNAIATEMARDHGIPINDLYALAATNPDHIGRDGVHFSGAGRTAQGSQVAAHIAEYLSAQ